MIAAAPKPGERAANTNAMSASKPAPPRYRPPNARGFVSKPSKHSLHRAFDVVFNEDKARNGKDNGAANLTINPAKMIKRQRSAFVGED
jgi:hypothetical protein